MPIIISYNFEFLEIGCSEIGCSEGESTVTINKIIIRKRKRNMGQNISERSHVGGISF